MQWACSSVNWNPELLVPQLQGNTSRQWEGWAVSACRAAVATAASPLRPRHQAGWQRLAHPLYPRRLPVRRAGAARPSPRPEQERASPWAGLSGWLSCWTYSRRGLHPARTRLDWRRCASGLCWTRRSPSRQGRETRSWSGAFVWTFTRCAWPTQRQVRAAAAHAAAARCARRLACGRPCHARLRQQPGLCVLANRDVRRAQTVLLNSCSPALRCAGLRRSGCPARRLVQAACHPAVLCCRWVGAAARRGVLSGSARLLLPGGCAGGPCCGPPACTDCVAVVAPRLLASPFVAKEAELLTPTCPILLSILRCLLV